MRLRGAKGLLARLAHGLSFPDYFGANWDALIDCLSDLSWSNAPDVVIDMQPRLRLVFRIKDRETLAKALTT